MAEEVTIRLQGHPESAIRAIEEVRAALATLQNQTVRVRVEQDKATASSKKAEAALGDQADAEKELGKQTVARLASQLKASDLEQRVAVTRLKAAKATEDEAQAIIDENEAMARGRVHRQRVFEDLQKEIVQRRKNAEQLDKGAAKIRTIDDQLMASGKRNTDAWTRLWEGRAATVEKASRRMERAQGGGGGGRRGGILGALGRMDNPTQKFGGVELGRSGVSPRTLGMLGAGAGIVGLVGPLTDLIGLIGAIPAGLGAAGLAFAAFKSVGSAAMNKAVDDQKKATEKFKAGTITAKAYANAMKNALVGLSKEQQAALPFFREWDTIITKTAEKMRSKMLPALGDFSKGLRANRQAIIGAFSGGAGIVGHGVSQAGGFLASRQGKEGVQALSSSSQNLLSGFARGGVNGMEALLSIVKAARPMVNALANDITRMSARFAAWTSSFGGQQTLRAWFLRAEDAATKFSHVLFNITGAIVGLGRGIGGGMLTTLDDLTNRMNNWTGSAEGQKKIADIWAQVAHFAGIVGTVITNLLPSIATAVSGLAKVMGFLTTKVPGGANTIGTIIGANLVTGGIAGGLIKTGAKGAGKGLLGQIGGKAAGTAAGAAGGGALAVEGAAVGAALLPVVATVGLIAGGITGIILLSRHFKGAADESSKAWDRVAAATARTRASVLSVASANAAQRTRVATTASLTSQAPSARLSLFDAKDRLAADKAALPGLKGSERQRMKIQIDVDSQAVKDARDELLKLRSAIDAASTSENRHADDSREEGRAAVGAAQQQMQALQQLTDVAARNNATLFKDGARGRQAAGQQALQFAAAMDQQAAALKGTDRAASGYARTAAGLARQLHRIPTSVEVNIKVAEDAALYSINHVKSLLASIHDKNVRLSVTQSVSSINPIGRPAPGGGGKGSHGMAGMKITTPTAIVGEQAPVHPEFVIATNPQYRARNKGLVSQAAAALGGQVQFFAQGGVMGGGVATPGTGAGHTAPGGLGGRTTPPPVSGLTGIQAALSLSGAYAGGAGATLGTAAAAKYAGIPAQLKNLRAQINALTKAITGDDSFIAHEKDVVLGLHRKMRAEKNAGKREALRRQVENITNHLVPNRKSAKAGRKKKITADNALIDDLTSQLGIVPGSEAFSNLVAIVEGEQIAAGELTPPRTDLADSLKQREIQDYKQRIAFLLSFTSAKSTQSNQDLWAAAASELSGRKGELTTLTGADDSTTGGGGDSTSSGAADNGDKDQALAMLAELAQFARQGRLSDLIGDSELALAMQFIGQQVGSFAKGTPFVKKSGMAAVHYGERIVPAHENTSSGSGGPVTGELTLVGTDALTTALAKALGPKINVTMGREARMLARQGTR